MLAYFKLSQEEVTLPVIIACLSVLNEQDEELKDEPRMKKMSFSMC